VWDLGLALDHSVRTPAEARKTAADDLKVQLGLLDARHIAGDPALTSALRSAVLADWRNRRRNVSPPCTRCARNAPSARANCPPPRTDLKEARGGLRDATALRAVAASWLADAPHQGLEEARTRLLDARDALHLVTGRATDRLALQEQDQVAAALGLLDADTLLSPGLRGRPPDLLRSDVTWREVERVLRSARTGPRRRGLLAAPARRLRTGRRPRRPGRAGARAARRRRRGAGG